MGNEIVFSLGPKLDTKLGLHTTMGVSGGSKQGGLKEIIPPIPLPHNSFVLSNIQP